MPSKDSTKKITAITTKMKNSVLAILAAPDATPPKPNTAATKEITAKIKAESSATAVFKKKDYEGNINRLKRCKAECQF